MSAATQTVSPGYLVPPGLYAAAAVRGPSRRRLVLHLAAGLGVLIIAAVVVFELLSPSPPRYVCPPACGQPPMGTPVDRLPHFTSPNGDFSVAYPREGSAYTLTMKPNGVAAEYIAGDKGTLQLFSEPATGRTPREIAQSLIRATYPDAVKDYEIPNAMVGYQLGYGEVADVYPQNASGKFVRLRVVMLVAEKNGLALIASAVGPYHKFSPDYGTGQPSGANLELALDMAKYVNSFRWRGDPRR